MTRVGIISITKARLFVFKSAFSNRIKSYQKDSVTEHNIQKILFRLYRYKLPVFTIYLLLTPPVFPFKRHAH